MRAGPSELPTVQAGPSEPPTVRAGPSEPPTVQGGPTAQSVARKVRVLLLRKAVGLWHSLQNGLEELGSVHTFILQCGSPLCAGNRWVLST